VRRAAVAKLMNPLRVGSRAEATPIPVCGRGADSCGNIALDAFEGLAEAESLAAVEALSDARMLATVAKTALRRMWPLRALAALAEVHVLGSDRQARRLEPIRLAAAGGSAGSRGNPQRRAHSDFKDTGIAAVERLDDRGDLKDAARGRTKSALKRARVILREMDERAETQAVETDAAEEYGVATPRATSLALPPPRSKSPLPATPALVECGRDDVERGRDDVERGGEDLAARAQAELEDRPAPRERTG